MENLRCTIHGSRAFVIRWGVMHKLVRVVAMRPAHDQCRNTRIFQPIHGFM
jgi:hypothetical protein